MIPLLIRPRWISWKNSWHTSNRSELRRVSRLGRDIILGLLSCAMMYTLCRGTTTTFQKLQEAINIAYIGPSLPLGLMFMGLLAMLLFSNAVSALGTLFLAQDLELTLAAPIRFTSFFFGKLVDVVLSASWMAIVFVIPVLVGCAMHFHASIWFWLVVVAALIPYFVIPAAISMAVVTVFARCIPAQYTRTVFIVCGVGTLLMLYALGQIILPESSSFQSADDILQILSVLSLPNTTSSPSYWTAKTMEATLMGENVKALPYLSMLYACAIGSSAVAYLLLRLFHRDAYALARNSRYSVKLHSRRAQARLASLLPFVPSPYRALIAKELKLFSRDMAQALQLLLLLGLCIIYLYNFRVLRAVGNLPVHSELWWEGLLVICNIAMGAFVITAVCTRFVFPSVSIEGQAYWIVQTSPIPIRMLLRAKFWCWLVPVATISSVILASGALAINAEPRIVILNGIASWIMCYGIVGLGIGLGAYYANFNWEHHSQLAGSFGSLIYMLSCTMLIFINILPAALIIFLRTLKLLGYEFSDLQWYTTVTVTALLLVYINYATTRWALVLGEKALNARR